MGWISDRWNTTSDSKDKLQFLQDNRTGLCGWHRHFGPSNGFSVDDNRSFYRFHQRFNELQYHWFTVLYSSLSDVVFDGPETIAKFGVRRAGGSGTRNFTCFSLSIGWPHGIVPRRVSSNARTSSCTTRGRGYSEPLRLLVASLTLLLPLHPV
jgi:hypothetical protein